MAVTADEVIALAKNTAALKPEQLEKILKFAPKMGQADLDNVHKLVTDVKKAEEGVKEELAVRQEVDAQYKVFKKEKTMEELHAAEGAAQAEDEKAAEGLINNI